LTQQKYKKILSLKHAKKHSMIAEKYRKTNHLSLFLKNNYEYDVAYIERVCIFALSFSIIKTKLL